MDQVRSNDHLVLPSVALTDWMEEEQEEVRESVARKCLAVHTQRLFSNRYNDSLFLNLYKYLHEFIFRFCLFAKIWKRRNQRFLSKISSVDIYYLHVYSCPTEWIYSRD